MSYDQLASAESLAKTIAALEANGIHAIAVANGAEAKKIALSLIPEGSEVMVSTSTTLDTLGLSDEINESEKFDSVKKKLAAMNRDTDNRQMQRIGAAPEYVIGSVHAVTENGEVLVASRTGSQLPAYAYGATHVIWVVGTQKIVKDKEDGVKRIYEYTLPLESERARKAYGVEGSGVNKLLLFNEEFPGRITIILVPEVLGF